MKRTRSRSAELLYLEEIQREVETSDDGQGTGSRMEVERRREVLEEVKVDRVRVDDQVKCPQQS